MSVVVSLRGTNGAGKSTLVRAVTSRLRLAYHDTAPGRRAPLGTVWWKPGDERSSGVSGSLYVPGHYEIANGGVDTLPDLTTAYRAIADYAESKVDVLYEGKNLSDGPARLVALHNDVREHGVQCCAVLVQPPLEQCVASVRARGHSIKEDTIERLYRKSITDCMALERYGVDVHRFTDRAAALRKVLELLEIY